MRRNELDEDEGGEHVWEAWEMERSHGSQSAGRRESGVGQTWP